MDFIESKIDTSSADFKENRAYFQGLVDELNTELTQARAGGGPRAHERHTSQNKMLVRDRIDAVNGVIHREYRVHPYLSAAF